MKAVRLSCKIEWKGVKRAISKTLPWSRWVTPLAVPPFCACAAGGALTVSRAG